MSSATIVQTGSKPWGVLMLDTQFPRWMGDIGCPVGWPVDLRYQKVKGMFPKEIVRSSETLQQHDVLPLFVKAAEDSFASACVHIKFVVAATIVGRQCNSRCIDNG
jgi:hypothetical protein